MEEKNVNVAVKISLWDTNFKGEPLLDAKERTYLKTTAKQRVVIEEGDQIKVWVNHYKKQGDKQPSHNIVIDTPTDKYDHLWKKEAVPNDASPRPSPIVDAYGVNDDIPF